MSKKTTHTAHEITTPKPAHEPGLSEDLSPEALARIRQAYREFEEKYVKNAPPFTTAHSQKIKDDLFAELNHGATDETTKRKQPAKSERRVVSDPDYVADREQSDGQMPKRMEQQRRGKPVSRPKEPR
jgi:hypothetical protein